MNDDLGEHSDSRKPLFAVVFSLVVGASVLAALLLLFVVLPGLAESRAIGFWIASWAYLACQSSWVSKYGRSLTANSQTARRITVAAQVSAVVLAVIAFEIAVLNG